MNVRKILDTTPHLRSDPAFKLASGRLPDTGRDLCSQPTLSRLENAPRLRDVMVPSQPASMRVLVFLRSARVR